MISSGLLCEPTVLNCVCISFFGLFFSYCKVGYKISFVQTIGYIVLIVFGFLRHKNKMKGNKKTDNWTLVKEGVCVPRKCKNNHSRVKFFFIILQSHEGSRLFHHRSKFFCNPIFLINTLFFKRSYLSGLKNRLLLLLNSKVANFFFSDSKIMQLVDTTIIRLIKEFSLLFFVMSAIVSKSH